VSAVRFRPQPPFKTLVFKAYLEAEGKIASEIASETAAKKRSAPFLLQCQTITNRLPINGARPG
jgi:hypothetical protein